MATGVRAKELRELRIMDVDVVEAVLTLNQYYNFDISDLVNIVDECNPLEDFKAKGKKFTMK